MGPEPPSDRTQGLTPQEGERILRFSNLAPGRLFAGRYRLGGSIGAGGSGEVFRAIDEITSTSVAVKVLFPGSSQSNLDRLRREIQMVRQLTHPGILKVFDIGTAEGLLFIVSELLDGESLGQRMAREGPLAPNRAEGILRDIFLALAAAHAEGVVHRDIKPGNVFFDRSRGTTPERLVLLDFGLARPTEGSGMTTVGRFLGTPEYCSPEQVRGETQIGPASDLYSCGVILWEMLAGSPPFQGDSEVGILNAHLNQYPRDRRGGLQRAPRHLKDLAFRLLEKKPNRRPRTATAALNLLRPRGSLSVGWSSAARWVRHTRWARNTGGALLSVLAAAAAFWSAQPVSVVPEGTGLAWTTRVRFRFHTGRYSRPVTTVALEKPPRGPFTGVFLALEGPPHVSDPSSPLRFQPVIQYQATPFSPPETLCSDSEYFFWRTTYPGLNTPMQIKEVLSLGHDHETGSPLVCVRSHQDSSFPATLDFFSGKLWWRTYLHPGYFTKMTSGPAENGGPPFVFAMAYNNHATLHVAAMGIPANATAAGQAPPFRAPLEHNRRAGGWYTFFPFREEGPVGDIRIAKGILEFSFGGGEKIFLRARDGVPVDPEVRGGLSPEQWAERRENLIQSLLRAAQEEQTGIPERGAELLEQWALEGGGGPEMFSIALFRSAQLRLASAARVGPDAYQQALNDIQESRRHESLPSRARLLHAELLARLGHKERFAELIRGWGRFQEEEHYVYEWLLVSWLGGLSSPPEGLAGFWNVNQYEERGWGLVFQMANAIRKGLFDLPEKQMAVFTNPRLTWDIHFYWLARAALDRPAPNPTRALEWLDKARKGQKQGWSLPLRISEIWAHRLQTSRPAPQEELQEAHEELQQLDRLAAGDLHARILLPFAARDLLRLAQADGDSRLAAQARAVLDRNPLNMK